MNELLKELKKGIDTMRRDRLELNMLSTDRHNKKISFKVLPETLRQQGYESLYLFSGSTFSGISGSNLFTSLIEKAQSQIWALRGRNPDLDLNITGCSAGLDSYSCLPYGTVTG